MGKKKGGKSQGYVSKGTHRNVAKWCCNAMRREREPTVESILQRERMRSECRDPKLREKYAEENRVKSAATDLFARYSGIATWAACVQAVKTDSVSQFHNKYGSRQKA